MRLTRSVTHQRWSSRVICVQVKIHICLIKTGGEWHNSYRQKPKNVKQMWVSQTKYIEEWLMCICEEDTIIHRRFIRLEVMITVHKSSSMKSSVTWPTSSLFTTIGSTSVLNKGSSSFSISSPSGTSHTCLFCTTWTIFQLVPFLGP